MSDKNFDIDDILGGSKENVGDASLSAEKPKKAEVDEIDELLAELKNRPRRRRLAEAENDNGEEKVSAPAPASIPEAKEPEAVIADEEDASEEPKEEKEAAIIGNDDIKKHFGKDSDIEDEFDEDEDEDEDEDDEEDIPVRKVSNSRSRSADGRSSGKKRSGKSSGRRKKKGIGFNGSIFGGIILVTIILTVSLVLAVAGLTLGMEYYGIGKDDNEISFNIPEGSTNEDIADLLVENGIIKNKKLFLYTLKIMKPSTIYPGDIKLQPSKPYSDIIEELEKQRESYETVTVTFTEGEYLIDIAQKLEKNNVCAADDFLFEFNRDMGFKFESYLTENKNVFYAREGYLFPDTYEFYVNDTPYNIARILRDHYDSKMNEAMYKKMNDQGLTLNETITLASIVQLEAANVDEMPKVASVFLNRLRDSDTFPMLQSDTTYNYINKVIKPNTKNDDLAEHYVEYYDTYAIDGLPAGPICNPGMDAIKAVLNPAKTDYYYFCNDIETGETFYAETLDEHEKNLVKAGRGDQIVDDTADDGDVSDEKNDEENYNE
ncbi:endolytic transglycosylase MltG [Ruminococcus albus]|uniref:Endolytic murein transglycosylase n=1 Tax=Ruminococcus albus TaxID=1264 RepID=A0A1I1E151_RUMAL|nr:endolytic transglycosylase MltG [Ruminococcus albus]SFB80794.1 UPF0755 protein [Ruminococcus albus]